MNIIRKFLISFIALFSILTISFYNENIDINAVVNDYYNEISSDAVGVPLKMQLRDLTTKTHKYKTSYDDCRYFDKINGKTYVNPDQDPNNKNNIILFWSGLSVPKTWDKGKTWNREHVWPQSKSWFETSGAGSDLHHIRPVDPSVNTSHNNNPYGIVNDGKFVTTSEKNGSIQTECKIGGETFEPCDNRKGDVARIIFYLLTRYPEGDSYTISKDNVATSLDMLLEWNTMDPVDESEIWRNDAVQGIQGNRNPFIDNQNYADLIWDINASVEKTYNVNVEFDTNVCDVVITGNKQGLGYKGDVTISVNMKEGYTFLGLFDKVTNQVVSSNLQYNIRNISKDYNLKVNYQNNEIPIPPIPPIVNNSFNLVKNANKLKIGDEIIIVGVDSDNLYYAMSNVQNKNNRSQVLVSNVNNSIEATDATQVIKLVNGNKPNTFGLAMKNEQGNYEYLYAASNSSNYLKTYSTLDDDGSWSFEYIDGLFNIYANGTNSHNLLRYNKGSNLFSCYAVGNSQDNVLIFKKSSSLEQTINAFEGLDTLTSIYVKYHNSENNYEMIEGGIRFGAFITKEMYDILKNSGGKFGIEIYKGSNSDWNNANLRTYELTPVRVDHENALEESPVGNYYQFALVLTNMHYQDIDTLANARIYVEVNDTRHYMNYSSKTFREVVNIYLTMTDNQSINDHRGILEHIKDYK